MSFRQLVTELRSPELGESHLAPPFSEGASLWCNLCHPLSELEDVIHSFPKSVYTKNVESSWKTTQIRIL